MTFCEVKSFNFLSTNILCLQTPFQMVSGDINQRSSNASTKTSSFILSHFCVCVCGQFGGPCAHALMHLDTFFCGLTRSIGPYLDIQSGTLQEGGADDCQISRGLMIAIKKRQLLPLLPSQALLVDNSHSSGVFVVLLQINRSMTDTLINPLLTLEHILCAQRSSTIFQTSLHRYNSDN